MCTFCDFSITEVDNYRVIINEMNIIDIEINRIIETNSAAKINY